MEPEVIYCYRCGRRVPRQGTKCWYCDAPTRRVLRPPRLCPFCDEKIGQKAIKCPHCGEFLDGRPRPSEGGGAPQVTFVIDKAVIQGQQPLMLEGGSSIPPGIAEALSASTVQAIETSNPALLDQTGVKALPAPAASVDSAQPALAGPPAKIGEQRALQRVEAELIPDDDSETALVVSEPSTALQRANTLGGLARDAGYALARIARTALSSPAAETAPTSPAAPEDGAGRFRICGVCHTEALSEDNYCFHCGSVMREEAAHPKPARINAPTRSNFFLYAIAIACTAAFVYLGRFAADAAPPILLPILVGVSFLLLVIGFFRRRTSFNQLLTIVLLAVWVSAILLVLFDLPLPF